MRSRQRRRRETRHDQSADPWCDRRLARNTTRISLETTVAELTPYLRRANRLKSPDAKRAHIVEADVLDSDALEAAMQGMDIVYANLAGDLPRQARTIIAAMHSAGLRRHVFISPMGVYGEVPGERYRGILDPYRDAALEIEGSEFDYTILRP